MFMQIGTTALMYASYKGEAGTVRILLDCGAVIDLRDNVRIIDMILCNCMHGLTLYTCHSMK